MLGEVLAGVADLEEAGTAIEDWEGRRCQRGALESSGAKADLPMGD